MVSPKMKVLPPLRHSGSKEFVRKKPSDKYGTLSKDVELSSECNSDPDKLVIDKKNENSHSDDQETSVL